IGLRLFVACARQRLAAEGALDLFAGKGARRTGKGSLGSSRNKLALAVDILARRCSAGHGYLAVHHRHGGLGKGRTDRERRRDARRAEREHPAARGNGLIRLAGASGRSVALFHAQTHSLSAPRAKRKSRRTSVPIPLWHTRAARI